MTEQVHNLPLTKDKRLFVRLPGVLLQEIEINAARQYMTVSEYVRSVLAQDVLRKAQTVNKATGKN